MPSTQVQVAVWRSQADLVALKHAFFDTSSSVATRQHACETVRMWEQLGNLPHAVVATADLTDALLTDIDHRDGEAMNARTRLGVYMSAWTRFVDGMVDSQQIYRTKRNMFEVARKIGMPTLFIELRHRAVHESKPMLHEFRQGVKEGLEWLFAWFWVEVQPESELDTDEEEGDDEEQEEESGDEVDEEEEDQTDGHETRVITTKPIRGSDSTTEAMDVDVDAEADVDGGSVSTDDHFKEQLATYVDAVLEEAAGRGKKRKPSNAANPLVGSICSLCGGGYDGANDAPWRLLASSVAASLPPVTPLSSQKSKQKPGRALRVAIEDLNGLDPILLGLARTAPPFATLLDEALTLEVAVPDPRHLDSLRDSATALLLHMHSSDPWRWYRDAGFVNSEVLRETCEERRNDWTKQILVSLERDRVATRDA